MSETKVSFDLEQLEGVGGTFAKKLKELGYHNIAVLAYAGSAEVATKLGKPQDFAEELILKAYKFVKENKVLEKEIITTKEKLEQEKDQDKLTTGTKNINKLLGGGIQTGAITEFVAEAASGKSQLCFQLAVLATQPKSKGGLEGNVLYIDTEHTYKAQRIEQIIKERGLDYDIMDKIYLRKPEASVFLELFIKDIHRLIEEYNIKLVIVDSFSNLHRQEFLGREHLADRQHKFSQMINTLWKASRQGVAVVITNQVLQNPSGNAYANPNIAVGGTVIGHGTTHRIYLRKAGQGYVAKIIDSPELPAEETSYKITPKGVEDYNPKTKVIGSEEPKEEE